MLRELACELELDLERSWMIGDGESDVEAGKAAGCRTALLASGSAGVGADVVAPSLDRASQLIAAAASTV